MVTTPLQALRDAFPERAKDLKLNLESLLRDSSLNEAQRLGVALACAAALRSDPLREALLAETLDRAGSAVAEDALAVSALNACETCIQAHERELRNAGMTEVQIHDAVRLAAVVAGSAAALA